MHYYRFGEKPLYLYEDNSGIYFGSEPKFIFELIGHRLPINKNHLLRYLINGYKALYKTGETFFEGLKEVKPGTALRINFKGIKSEYKYWVPNFNQQEEKLSFDEAVHDTRHALINSVKLRLRSEMGNRP